MSDDKKSTSTGANTRWWESYLVRYFSGAIVGAICLTAIFLYADWRLYGGAHTQSSANEQNLPMSAIAFMLISGGLVYSYIISAPITVIHFGRSGRSVLERQVRYFWLGWVITLLALQVIYITGGVTDMACRLVVWCLLLLVSLIYLLASSQCVSPGDSGEGASQEKHVSRKKKRSQEAWRTRWSALSWGGALLAVVMLVAHALGLQGRPAVVSLMAFALPTLFVGGMQYVTLFRIFDTEPALHRFYRRLIRARTMDNSTDVRETYTHLREHSNATFIVLLELCFSAFLIFCLEVFAGHAVPGNSVGGAGVVVSESMVNAVLLLIAFWMTPNLFMWSRANQLEKDFAERPLLYAARAKSAAEIDPAPRVRVPKRSR